ncbi:MAG: tetratricopeptide repeat protein [Deltaproteobacteria bacterium]|nr:MAG: tetratricopeptide repeat protein [Deltaproteobacteria bacterium]TMB13271.1 MAG: tetratricopeptide repeat protein [Deltaproteobacteria bacterium]
MAVVLARQGKTDGAIAECSEALRLDPDLSIQQSPMWSRFVRAATTFGLRGPWSPASHSVNALPPRCRPGPHGPRLPHTVGR